MMKKIFLVSLLVLGLLVVGCGNKNLGENESIYNGELTVSGVGPEISFEPTIEEGTLALKGSFEDHADHVFFNEGTWEGYFKEEADYLPGNTVKFRGVVEFIDGAAGNHYYNVKSIDKLEVVKYPNAEEIKEIFDGYSYCESDSDCGYFMGECPLGCYIPLNVKYMDIASNMVSNFVNHLGDERCVYGCLYMDKAVCNNYKCEMVEADTEDDVHGCGGLYKDPDFDSEVCKDVHDPVCANDGKTYENDCLACIEPLVETYTFGKCKDNSEIECTPEEKAAENCNMIYKPVCGSDSITYGNSCVACQSETVESYTIGECESSAFTIEGDSGYLHEVMEILERDGAVTCDLFYTDYDRQVHGFFMADNDRFYSAMDDYSDNFQRNVFYTLAVDGKYYSWSSFADSEKIAIDSPADIESEIAVLLMDKGQYPDFEMNCSGGIENEELFKLPDFSTPITM